MILYSAQALFLGAVLLCATLSGRRLDAFLTAFVCLWTFGVVAIYWKYGAAQNHWYSDDQVVQARLVDYVNQNPLVYSLRGIVQLRYVVTIPAAILTRIGIDSLLALKFLQAVSFVLIYRLVRAHFRIENLKFKAWYIVLFCGPLIAFMSLLALRDLALAYFALAIMIGRDLRMYAIGWIGLFLLRPHLAVALVFGLLLGYAISRIRLNFHLLYLPLIVLISFLFGTYAYIVGRHFQYNLPLEFGTVSQLWTQSAFIRLVANFGGLQFLLFDSDIVNLSIIRLILLRLVFVDTFIVPLLFVWTMISIEKFQRQSISVLAAFAFFIGLISTTDYNSSRQNVPFLVLMGVTVITHFASRDRRESLEAPAIAKPKVDAVAIARGF
ncbi:MAG: hypothetical protein WC864_07350 [Ilumatobacteraceae bacterium]